MQCRAAAEFGIGVRNSAHAHTKASDNLGEYLLSNEETCCFSQIPMFVRPVVPVSE